MRPFLFFDHFGPEELEPFRDNDVRPHPHIGLSTVTYLFGGRIVHRDSIGSVQTIEPGAVNWMTAGRGIAHSERTPPELRSVRRRTHGLQLWSGMPKALEEIEPSFAHTDKLAIPEDERERAQVRVLVGRAWGMESPVMEPYVMVVLPAGDTVRVEAETPARVMLIGGEPPNGVRTRRRA